MPTRAQIRKQVLDIASQGESDDLANMANVHINYVYQNVLTEARLNSEERYYSLTTVANQRTYGMPGEVKRVLDVEDTANQEQIWSAHPRQYDRDYPGNTDTGTPEFAYPYGTYGVQKQNADTDLVVSSSSALDTGSNFRVMILHRQGGALTRYVFNLLGTTGVNTTNLTDLDVGSLERIVTLPAENSVFNGTVTLTDQPTTSNVLAVIPPWWQSMDFQWIAFHPIPDAALTYEIRAEASKAPLMHDEDWPDFDQQYHDLLFLGAAARLLPFVGKSTLAKSYMEDYKARLVDFIGSLPNQFNHQRQMADISNRTRSSLSRLPRITVTP